MKTPVTRKSLQEHWNYAWWKYALLAVLAAFCWNIVYTMTAYHPPEGAKVTVYAYAWGDEEPLSTYMEEVRQNEMSDMEAMYSVFYMVDEQYTPMQLTAFIAAGEGDIYLFDRNYFQSYAGQGAFLPLEQVPEIVELCERAGVDLTRGWRANTETKEKHLYGIPTSEFPGMKKFMYDPSDSYLCVMVNNQNDENVLKFLSILLRDTVATATDLPEV